MQVYKAIIAVLKDCKAIGKNQKNAAQGYSFRGIDDFYNEMHDLFAKHELFVVPQILDLRREERQGKSGGLLIWTVLRIKFTFTASDGSKVEAETIGEAMDSGDKGANKAMSAALKYLLTQTFLVPTDDLEDADSNTPPPLAPTGDKTKVTRQSGADLGAKGYDALIAEMSAFFEGMQEVAVCKEIAVADGVYKEGDHVTFGQVALDMLKKRNVSFSLKAGKLQATQLTQAAYEGALEVVVRVRDEMEKSKVA